MVPPQLTSRLGFINPGLTLFPIWKSAAEKSADVPEPMDSPMAPIQRDFAISATSTWLAARNISGFQWFQSCKKATLSPNRIINNHEKLVGVWNHGILWLSIQLGTIIPFDFHICTEVGLIFLSDRSRPRSPYDHNGSLGWIYGKG